MDSVERSASKIGRQPEEIREVQRSAAIQIHMGDRLVDLLPEGSREFKEVCKIDAAILVEVRRQTDQ